MAMQRYDGIAQDSSGNAQAGVLVTVRDRVTGNVAALYNDEAYTAKANPLTTDGQGAFWFYAPDGRYSIATPEQTLPNAMLFSGAARETMVTKAVAEVVNNSTVFQDDDDFFFSVGKAETWAFQISARIDSNTAAGIKCIWALPAGVTSSFVAFWIYDGVTGVASVLNDADAGFSYAGGVGLSLDPMMFTGYITTTTTAGTAQFRWAQLAAHASDTKIREASSMMAWRVG